MAASMLRSCNASMACVLGQPCFFKARPCVQLRLKHYSRLAARRPCRPTKGIQSHDGGMFEPHKPQQHSNRSHAPVNGHSAEQDSSEEQKPPILRLLHAFRQVSLAAMIILLGLSRAVSAHASVIPPVDPVPTVTAYEDVRHGETVHSEAGVSDSVETRCRDTGIQLAANQLNVPVKDRKGPKIDPTISRVPDPDRVPVHATIASGLPQTTWRIDRLKEMTYTQFWHLIQEGSIERVKYAADKRSIMVTTKATAPGGARTEKVGLPFDPDLFDHMVEHGVVIEANTISPIFGVIQSLLRLAFPITLAFYLVKISFVLGENTQQDKLFGGARLEMVTGKDATVTFADIAGIDQVKAEIIELVQFLRSPQRFLDLGARSPAGVLLVGPPGTGKTLLAKAIAGEAGVPFFTAAGTEFMEMFVGIGASRVRDMFQRARDNAPCILFIDEFDGLGKQRSFSAMGNDESVHTINQLLTEMDGFEDNTGVVVMAATNRPAALDSALTRPGRFDRIIQLPLPDVEVHARDKELEDDIDFHKVARATAGSTGAELMNLMNQSAIVTVRQGRKKITQADIFEALEKIHREKFGGGGTATQFEDEAVPELLRRSIAVYEAARCVIGYMTPFYDEISKVSVCPGGLASGYTYFIPQEEHLESQVVTRGYLEGRMVVGMAGRCAEKLVMGEGNVTTAGASDLEHVNNIAREMVYRCGFSKRLGPVSLMDNEDVYINKEQSRSIANISTELAAIALTEVEELVEGAQAKALYGLTLNYKPLHALVDRLLRDSTLTGEQVAEVLDGAGLVPFPDPFVEGFAWDEEGRLVYPGMGDQDEMDDVYGDDGSIISTAEGAEEGAEAETDEEDLEDEEVVDPVGMWHPNNPYQVRIDLPDILTV
ncbi:hypothetical protein ABBQ32_013378 [Trebouxia sp. C0010 RCD-2024]